MIQVQKLLQMLLPPLAPVEKYQLEDKYSIHNIELLYRFGKFELNNGAPYPILIGIISRLHCFNLF